MIGKLPKSSKGGHVYLLAAVEKIYQVGRGHSCHQQKWQDNGEVLRVHSYRFGVPHSIITDNGSNFISKEFQDFCEGLRMKISYASMAHPQTNGQVEKANGLVDV